MIGTSLLFSGSIAGLLGPGDIATPTAGYSLRPLSVSYSGAVVRVRRSGDNEEKDFNASGITDGQLSDFLNVFTESGHILNVYEHFKREFTESPLTFYNFEDVSLVCNCIEESSGLIAYDALANMVSHQVAVYTDIDYPTIDDPSLVSPCNDGQADELNAFDDLLNLTTQNDGYVVTWYDQFGSNDATQTTAAEQPKIWDASTGLVTENGKPALEFDGVDDYLKIENSASDGTNPLDINGDILCSMILSPTEARSAYVFNNYQGSSAPYTGQHILWHQDPAGADVTFETSYDDNSTPSTLVSTSQSLGQYIVTNVRNDGGTNYLYINGAQNVSGADTATGDILSDQDWVIGARAEDATGEIWKGNMQEIVLYDSDQSANRTAIEDNINGYYDIY